MATASSILDQYVAKFDDTRVNGLAYLNDRYRSMVVDAEWFQKEATLATTVADQAEYALPTGIEDLRAVYVGDTQYVPVSIEGFKSLSDPDSENWSSLPVFAEDYTSAGVLQIQLSPTPDTSGDTITGLSSGNPTALTDTTNAAGTPSIPDDLHRYLRDGLWSDGFNEVDERPDMAQVYEQRFLEGIKKLVKRRNSRFGSGASRMGVSVAGS
jgi:hypothetical protein